MKNKIIIADASPLIALGKVNQLTLLEKLFNKVIIPQEVADECLFDRSRPGAIAIDSAIKQGFITVETTPKTPLYSQLSNLLDKGEAAAIVHAMEINSLLLIDEKLGRNKAKQLGLKIVGTAGLLLIAKQKKIIKKVQPIVMALKQNGYRLSDELIKEILKKAQEIK